MNKTELISVIRDPSKISKSDFIQLSKLDNEYPYFITSKILLAKASKQLKHKDAKRFISRAAIYSTDRALLKRYISGDLFFLSTAPPPSSLEEKSTTIQPKKERKREKKEATESTTKPVIPEIPSSHLDEILDDLKHDMENLKSSRLHFAELQQKIEEEEAVTAALRRAEQKKKTENRKETREIANNGEKPKATIKRDKDQVKKINKNASKNESLEVEKKNQTSNTSSPNKHDIIDNFIKKSPSIQRNSTKEDNTKSDLSEDSSNWNNDIASEYLAEIFLDQGNKKRAIEIYEALILKFPEKKSYFADLISKI